MRTLTLKKQMVISGPRGLWGGPFGSDSGLPWWFSGKESACQFRRLGFDSWFGKIPWSRKWQPAPVLLPGKFHGQRSLAGYSPGDRKESDTTEQLGSDSI